MSVTAHARSDVCTQHDRKVAHCVKQQQRLISIVVSTYKSLASYDFKTAATKHSIYIYQEFADHLMYSLPKVWMHTSNIQASQTFGK